MTEADAATTYPPREHGRFYPASLVLEIVLAADDDAAPLRVLSLLARRRCRLQEAAFTRAPGHDRARLRVSLATPPGREATVERWLEALVSVRSVERLPS